MKTKITALLLIIAAALTALISCGNAGGGGSVSYDDPYIEYTDYDERSQKIYDDILGDFHKAYTEAVKEKDQSKRYAQMVM